MRLGTEALLVLLALALYLFDASLFLAADEAVLRRGGRGRWRAGFGLDRWRLGGREPYLPPPLAPHRPLLRLRWRFDDAEGSRPPAARPVAVPVEIERLGVHALASLACIFVLLPAAFWQPWTVVTPAVLAVVLLLYANIGIGLVRAWRSRAALGLGRGPFASLAFECIACPPFSINLVRRLCARLPVDEDFAVAAARLLDAEAWAAAKAQCLRRVDEQIDYADDAGARIEALRAGRRRFVDSASAP